MKSVFYNDRLRISVTDKCNFKCFYCSNEGQTHDKKTFMDLKFFNKFISNIKEENIYVKKINITGGEPLLHKDIIEIIRMASYISNDVTLNTNGTLLNVPMINSMVKAGLNCIKFGVDNIFVSNSKPVTNKYVQSIEQLKDLILYSISLMPRSSMNIVITEYNIDYIDKILDWIIYNKIDKVELIELIRYDFKTRRGGLYDSVNFIELIKKVKNKFSRIQYNPYLAKYIAHHNSGLIIQFAEDFCKRRVCGNLWTRINSSGEFAPCIKNADTYKIDLYSSLEEQFTKLKMTACNLFSGMIPRNENGFVLKCAYEIKDISYNSMSNITNEYTDIDL